jgi:hypothetical protein
MPSDKTYALAAVAWPRCPSIRIESSVGTRIARLPLNFLETCGDNTWSFVSYIISLLIIPDPGHPGSIIDVESGLPVDLLSIPYAGTFRFVERGMWAATMRKKTEIVKSAGKLSEVSFAPGPTLAATGELGDSDGSEPTAFMGQVCSAALHRFAECS